MDQGEIAAGIVKSLDRLAKTYSTLRTRQSLVDEASSVTVAAERIIDVAALCGVEANVADSVAPLTAMLFYGKVREAAGMYPWSELETEGRFIWKCGDRLDAQKARSSISAAAWKRYGKSKIKTRIEGCAVIVSVIRRRGQKLSDALRTQSLVCVPNESLDHEN